MRIALDFRVEELVVGRPILTPFRCYTNQEQDGQGSSRPISRHAQLRPAPARWALSGAQIDALGLVRNAD